MPLPRDVSNPLVLAKTLKHLARTSPRMPHQSDERWSSSTSQVEPVLASFSTTSGRRACRRLFARARSACQESTPIKSTAARRR